ncbi:MAG: DUF481 domain-containing protein [Gemmatimonadaceae bacterium]|nr:DUF481 domain-containing protein [Gemmatimonadaceae bacterium]
MSSILRRIVCAVAAVPLAASVLAAQEKPPEKPYAFTGDLGYVAVSGNQQLTTFSLGDKATYKLRRFLFTQQFNAVYSEAQGTANAEFYRFLARTDYALGGPFTVFGVLTWDRNRFAGIANKYEQQAGLAWKAVATKTDNLSLEAGGGLIQQDNLDGSSLSFGSGRTAGTWKHNFSEKAYFQQFGEYILNVQNTSDYRLNSESAIVAPINSFLSVKLSYLVRYQSLPPFRPNVTPATRFKTTDFVFTSGLQLTF